MTERFQISLWHAGRTKKLFDGGEAEFIKEVFSGDSGSFGSGVSNSSFEQPLAWRGHWVAC